MNKECTGGKGVRVGEGRVEGTPFLVRHKTMTFDINDNDISQEKTFSSTPEQGVSLSKITGVLQCSHTHSATKTWVGFAFSLGFLMSLFNSSQSECTALSRMQNLCNQ